MSAAPKQVAVFGSTGSIGTNALEVIAGSQGALQVVALSGHSNLELLAQQAARFQPRWVILTHPEASLNSSQWNWPAETEVLVGAEHAARIAASDDVDVVLAAVVGSAGLPATWAAVEAGKTVALANKETMVVAGSLINAVAARSGAKILPVDSEHSAVFQALQAGRHQELKKIILTASGGPFRTYTKEQMATVTVADALAHPTWNMGTKITIDSATMMNKALEIIEARWLFDLTPEQISVVVHPQSVVHSMVEFVDGSVVAQLSPPDMKLPIHYALHYPQRCPSVAETMDWTQTWRLDFAPPDFDRFPALELGLEVARSGGTAGAVLNAANEAAVAQFLGGELQFNEIVPTCRQILQSHHYHPSPSLDELLKWDRWARSEVKRWVCT